MICPFFEKIQYKRNLALSNGANKSTILLRMSDKQIEDLLTNDSFVRWITGDASAAEIEYWEGWVSRNVERKELVNQVEKLIRLTGADEISIPDPQGELKKFEASVRDYKQYAKKSDGAKIGSIQQSKNFFGAVAATIIILVIAIGFYLTFNANIESNSDGQQVIQREYETAYGEKKSFKLSDGSVIILNANSNLKYTSSVQSRQNMDVWLEGEAYFDITHLKGQEQRIFRVHTTDGTVEVLGTEFVVKTSSKGTRAVLSKGKVKIKVEEDSTGSDATLVMKPDERAHFVSGSRMIELQTVNTAVYTSWIKNKWHFDNTSLSEVTQRIEDTYGMEVTILTEKLKQRLLSGSIKSTNLEILRKALSKILNEPVVQQTDSTMVIGLKE